MGEPARRNPGIAVRAKEPGEVKHLSSRRKRNRRDSLSSGERKGKSLNSRNAKTAVVVAWGLWVYAGGVRRLLGEL